MMVSLFIFLLRSGTQVVSIVDEFPLNFCTELYPCSIEGHKLLMLISLQELPTIQWADLEKKTLVVYEF